MRTARRGVRLRERRRPKRSTFAKRIPPVCVRRGTARLRRRFNRHEVRRVPDRIPQLPHHSSAEDEVDAFGVGHAQLAVDDVARKAVAIAINFRADAPEFTVAAQAAAATRARSPCLQRAQAFLQAFLERAADGHRFAHAFHLRGERGVGLRNGGRTPAPRRQSTGSWWPRNRRSARSGRASRRGCRF